MEETLHLGDYGMEEHRIGEDLVWGFKSFRNAQDAVQYVMEVQYRVPGDPRVVYIRESRVEDPKAVVERQVAPRLVTQLIRILTDEQYRLDLHAGTAEPREW
ncbi:hypothetical protein SEA_MAGRITTE_81 [Microbacterium phage Magritte]|nr:hypothetical protein SEA_MAGRITTE_81 [Microbacterium phage Magritte]